MSQSFDCKLENVIVIGNGIRAESVKENGDIVIGNSSTLLRISCRGEVFLNGRHLGSDFEIYEGFRVLILSLSRLQDGISVGGALTEKGSQE